MILYLVVKKGEKDHHAYKIGGGSSTPATARVYHNFKLADKYNRDIYDVLVIDTEKQEKA